MHSTNNKIVSSNYNYSALASLSREKRVQKLATLTPHSLSRVCLQLIDIWPSIHQDSSGVIDDIVEVIVYFGKLAQLHNQEAIDTLSRFSNHIMWQGLLRHKFFINFDTNKQLFDEKVMDAYTQAINMMNYKPQYTPYVKKISENINTLFQEATTAEKKVNDQY